MLIRVAVMTGADEPMVVEVLPDAAMEPAGGLLACRWHGALLDMHETCYRQTCCSDNFGCFRSQGRLAPIAQAVARFWCSRDSQRWKSKD